MGDIFISYARENRDAVAGLAAALERCGWSVWWDRIIPPGKSFDEVLDAELNAASCVIVLWSHAAIASRWVREEAQEADNRSKLVPAMIEGALPPIGFRRIQAADLDGWAPDNERHPGWQVLKNAVGELVKKPSWGESRNLFGKRRTKPTYNFTTPAKTFPWPAIVISVLACIIGGPIGLIAVGWWWWKRQSRGAFGG